MKYVWNIMDFGYRAEDILWLVESGVLTLGYQSSSYLTGRVPELGFVDLPFLFARNDQARGAMDGKLGQFLASKIEERVNYRILGWFENGFRQTSNRLRTIRTPADLTGMRIRVLPSEVQARTFELLGAVPLRWDLTEAIAAIKAGTIDAQENPFANTVTYGVHKFHRYHSVTNHFYISRPIFLHRDTFEAWPKDLQEAMREAVAASVAYQRKLAEEEDVASRKAIVDEGCEIADLTGEELSAFSKAVQPLWADAQKTYGKEMFAMVPAVSASSEASTAASSKASSRLATGSRTRSRCELTAVLAPLVVRRREDQRPEHLVLRVRRVDRRDAHAGHVAVEHVGAVRRGIAPARESFGERVIAGRDVFHRDLGVGTATPVALFGGLADVMVDLVARRHGARVLFGKLHQVWIDGQRAEPVVAAIAGDHRLRGSRIELPALRQVPVEGRLARGHRRLGGAAGNAEQRQRGGHAQQRSANPRARHPPSPRKNPLRR